MLGVYMDIIEKNSIAESFIVVKQKLSITILSKKKIKKFAL